MATFNESLLGTTSGVDAASDDAHESHGSLGRTRLSFADVDEIDDFVATLAKFERGELTPDQWRAYRLVRGTYGQRQTGDASMLRVKIPQGVLDPPQLRALADVADNWSRGFAHITTRQNLQFHFIPLHDIEHAMRHLADTGLTTREACGNSVRNITACPYAGVSADEAFDVTPYAEALTRYLLRHPLSSVLPRKFKIAFEGCPEDHAFAAINDIGWWARRQGVNGSSRRGFRVTLAGGTSILPRSGITLYEFLPAGEIFEVAEAVIRVYHRLGDFKHKQRNRLKFLIRDIGYERWRAEFEKARAEVKAEGAPRLPFDPDHPPVEDAPSWSPSDAPALQDTTARVQASNLRGPGIVPEVRPFLTVLNGDFSRWRQTNVRPQKQAGYAGVVATVPLGDITAEQLRVLAELAPAFGDGTIRVTHDQDLVFRWVPVSRVGELYQQLAAAGLGLPDAGSAADVTSCPGAESCRLAVTQSRGLGRVLGEHLRARPDLVRQAGDLKLKISGCPNGCGQHHVAGIGFQGSVRRLGDRVVPQYFVMLGGGVESGEAHFGRLAAKIPARRVAEALERLIRLYRAEGGDLAASAFFRRVDLVRVKDLLADLEALSPEDAVPADYVDLGEDTEFKMEVMEGECSA
jgi:sulfite reductase beta subunit-like hemoprotein